MKVGRLSLRAGLLGHGNLTLTMGIVLIAGWILIGVFAPLIAPYDPIAQDVSNALHPPGFPHPFGTDNFGRDVLSRVIWGTRIDLAMGIGGVIAPLVIGCTIGLLAGYFGGIVDTLLMRLLDITISFPFFVLMIAIISILGPGLVSFFIALALNSDFIGLQAQDLNLITAVLVTVALVIPLLKKRLTRRKGV